MTFQLSDIKVVFDRLFRHLWRERENYQNEKAFEKENFPVKSKKELIISKGRFSVSDFNEYSMGSPEGKHLFRQECFEFITFHDSNCCLLRVLKDDAE